MGVQFYLSHVQQVRGTICSDCLGALPQKLRLPLVETFSDSDHLLGA